MSSKRISEDGKRPPLLLQAMIGAITLVVVAGVIFLGSRTHRETRKLATEQFNQQQLILARSAAAGIEAYFQELIAELSSLAKLPGIQQITPEGLRCMQHAYWGLPSRTSIRLVDRNGRLRLIYPCEDWRGTLIGKNYGEKNYFREALETGRISVKKVMNEQGEPRIRVAVPLYLTTRTKTVRIGDETGMIVTPIDPDNPESGKFQGVLAGSFDPRSIARKFIAPIGSGKTGYAYLLNEDGMFVVHPEEGFTGRNAFEVRAERNPDLSYEAAEQIHRKMMAGEEGAGRYLSGWHRGQRGRIEKLVAYTPVRMNGYTWSVAVCAPVGEVEAIIKGAKRTEWITLGLVILTLAIGGFFLLFLSYRWSRALENEVVNRTKDLRETRDYLNNLIRHANAPIIVWNPDRHVTIFNEAFEKMSGRSEAEMIGRPLDVLFPEDSRSNSMKRIEEASKGAHWKTEEIPILSRNGEIRMALWNSANIYGEDGETLIATVAQGQDITEHKQADEALQESEEKHRALFETAHDAIFLTDETGKFVDVNPAACASLGYSKKELLRLSNREIDADPRGYEAFLKARDGLEDGIAFEVNQRRKNGTLLPVEITGSIFTSAGQRLVLAIARDITQRKRAEEALLESEEKWRSLYESLPGGSFTINRQYIIEDVNEVLCAVTGFSKEELVGQLCDIICPKGPHNCPIFDAGKERIDNDETAVKTKDGRLVPILKSARKISMEHKEVIVENFQDITERKRLEEQLRQAQKMRAIGTLASGVAHDFNNLLTAIQGNTELALMNVPEDTFSYRKLSEIRKAAMRAANLTRQLLLFSRQQPMTMKLLDLNGIVEDESNMLNRLIGEHIVLSTELKPRLWKVEGDVGTIEQVIMNLVINARDAMPEGGQISIGSRNVQVDETYCGMHEEARPGKFVCLSVRDTGIGMDQGLLDRIFEPFFTTKGLGVGTGLGLSVVYGIVKKHEGWITVESDSGAGTLFSIYFPAVLRRSGKKEPPETPISLDEAFRGHKERILLVEDDYAIRALAEEILSREGYVVLPAATVQEAWNVFDRETGNFDLLFCDVVLPDGRGPELVKGLLEHRPGIRVLFTSGYSAGDSDGRALLEGEYPYLQKPYQLSDLLKAVHEALKAGIGGQGSGIRGQEAGKIENRDTEGE